MKIECISGKYSAQIPNPPLSTLCFKCPACGTAIDTWCYPDRDENMNCEARVEMFIKVFNRWVDAVQKYRIPCFVSEAERREQIQKIIEEVEKENGLLCQKTDSDTS